MGKLIDGINGPFLGKVGAGIGSSWKGIPYIKGPYKKRTGKSSEGERGNRNKFAMAQRWLQPTLDFVREGLKKLQPHRGWFSRRQILGNRFARFQARGSAPIL